MHVLVDAQVDARNEYGETALHIAVSVRSFTLVRLLVEKHAASLDCLDNDEASPLERAATQDHESCLLLADSRERCTLVFLLKK